MRGLFADIKFNASKISSKISAHSREHFINKLQDSIISIYCKGDDQRLFRRGLIKLHRLFESCVNDPEAYSSFTCNHRYRDMILDQLNNDPDPINRYLLLNLTHSRFEDYIRVRNALNSKKINQPFGYISLKIGPTAFALSNLGVILGFTSSTALITDNIMNGDYEIKSVKRPPKQERYKIIYVCGIDNRDPYFTEQLDSLSYFLPEADVSGILNKSRGMPLDLLEVVTHRFAPQVSSMREIVRATTNQIENELKDGKPVIVIGHSAGASVAKDAWKGLTATEKSKVGLVLVSSIVETPIKSSPTQIIIYNVNQSQGDPISLLPFVLDSDVIGTNLEGVNQYQGISNFPGHLIKSYINNDPSRTIQKEVRRIAREIIDSK